MPAFVVLVAATLTFAAPQHGGHAAGAFSVADAVLLKARAVEVFPYFWDGERFVPAPVVYLVRWESAYWLEADSGGKYAEVAVPLAEGPYLAVPRRAFNATPPGSRGAVPVDTPRGRVWLRFSERPSAEGLPPYAVVLYLNATRGLETHDAGISAPAGGQEGRALQLAPQPAAHDLYLFTVQSPPAWVRREGSALYFLNATGFSADGGYAVSAADRAYLGYRVHYIYVAVEGPGVSLVTLRVLCSDAPTTSPPACAVVRPLYYYQADLGVVYVFDNYNYLNKYVWAEVTLYSYDLPYAARATLSAGYLRPAASDPNWGAMVFEWRYVAAPQGWSAELPDGTRRVMVLASVYQGASSTPVLTVRDILVTNFANPPSQKVRFYVGFRLVKEVVLENQGGVYRHPGFSAPAPSALDYMRFNSSHVPVVVEFDPPLRSGGPSQQPAFSAAIELGGRRWPQIWRENARNWDWMNAPLLYLGQREGANEFVGNVYGFNVWNHYAFKNGTVNLLGKVDVETQLYIHPSFGSGIGMTMRVAASYIGFKRAPSGPAPYISYACIAQSSSNVQGLNVTGAGSLYAMQYWASAASAGYWFINTFLTFASLFMGVPGPASFVIWAAGELVTRALPRLDACSVGSASWGAALVDSAGVLSARSLLYYFAIFDSSRPAAPAAREYDLGVDLSMIREGDPSGNDYGYYTLYGKFRAVVLDWAYFPSWFDGPLEPYRYDGGILARVSKLR